MKDNTRQLLSRWNGEQVRADKIYEIIPLPGAEILDLVLTYSLICNFGWSYRSYFVIASRNRDVVATANAVNECSFISQVPYWAGDVETRSTSQKIPLELERAVAKFYPKRTIPEHIRNKIKLHCEAISEVVDYCIKNQTDDIPNI